MFSSVRIKKAGKGFISVLLVLAVMLSLIVPFEITVSAAEEGSATGSNIYAYYKLIDPNVNRTNKGYRNLELVFASSKPAAGSYYGDVIFKDFADREFVSTTYKFDSNGRIVPVWSYKQWSVSDTPSANLAPWSQNTLAASGSNIRKVTFQDRIAPKSIAGWFYGMSYLYEINGLEENLDTSRCENMSFAFWMMNTSKEIWTDINDNGVNIKGRYLQSLDLSNFDTSKVKKIDCFIYSSRLEHLDLSGFIFPSINDNIVTVTNPDNRRSGYTNQAGKYVYENYPNETTVPAKYLGYMVYQCYDLQDIKLDGMDLSSVENLSYLVTSTSITKLDLSNVKGPKNAYSCENLASKNEKLKEVIFGGEYIDEETGKTKEKYFEVGVTPQYAGLPRNGYDRPFTAGDEAGDTATADLKGYLNPFRSSAIWFGSTFSGCSSLESIDLKYLKTNGFSDSYEYNTTDEGKRAGLELGVRYQMNSFFANCTSLTHIENLDNLGYGQHYDGNWVARQMFINCESLQEIDLSNYYALVTGPGVFLGCSALKKLDLSGMGRGFVTNNYSNGSIYDAMAKGFQSYDNENASTTNPTGKTKRNVFEGCTELSEVVLSPYYYGETPREGLSDNTSGKTPKTANDVLTYMASYSFATCDADIPPVGDDVPWTKIKHPDDITVYNGKVYPANQTWNVRGFHFSDNSALVDVGTTKTTAELFGDFQPTYAGTWVRTDKITLDANGGTPRTQTFKGAAGVRLDPQKVEDAKIQEPTRVGYVFKGWVAKDDEGVKHYLEDQLELNSDEDPDNDVNVTAWRYYAEWEENKYTLKLNGNGGTTAALAAPANEEGYEYVTSDDKFVTETSGSGDSIKAVEYIAAPEIGYAAFYELSSTLFSRSGYILTGWNTRSNGEGDEFDANDSVNMLSSADGGEATLYAQWYKPDFILKFNAQGGSEVADRNYDLPSEYGYLPESSRDGYTFRGWYTAASGGKKVVTKSGTLASDEIRDVDPAYDTLYAQWDLNPTVVFSANAESAYFNGVPTQHTLPKVYKYGQNLGVIPTPEYGSAVIKEWNTEADGSGTVVDKDTIAGEDGTYYYAQWGYRPKFESNGGNYDTFPTYTIEDEPTYTLTTLPTITKENSTFLGWYFDGQNLTDALEGAGSVNVDLSTGKVIEARWTDNTYVEVILDSQGGMLSSTYQDLTDSSKYRVRVFKNTKIGELPAPIKAGSDFLGWNTAEDGSGDYCTADTTIGESGFTLYAIWAAKDCTVTFNAGEGALYDSSEATKKVRTGGKISNLPGAIRSTYTLEGWYTDLEDPTTKLTAETEITGDVTYYANWIKNANIESSDNLYSYDIRWTTPCNDYADNFGETLIIAPQTGNNPLAAQISVEFDVNEKPDTAVLLPAYSVKVLIPKKIFYGYDDAGKYIALGKDNIGIGLNKTDRDDTEFLYIDDDEDYLGYYVITNNDAITTARNYSFDINFTVTASELRSIKGGYTDENGYFCGTYFNERYPVSVLVDRDLDGVYESADGDTAATEDLTLEVHTDVKTTATTKTQWKASFDWNDDWGDRPDDADQYFYITWRLTSSHDKLSSQKFKISWSEATVHDGSYVTDYPEVRSNENKWLQTGTYTWIIVTKHTRKPEDEGWTTVKNEAILDVEYLSGHHEQFRTVCNDGGVYLLPDSPFRFDKFLSGSLVGTSDSFKHGGQDNILAHRTVNNLIYEVVYREYHNADNPTWNDTAKTYTTPARNIVITDGAKGQDDVRLSTVKGSDRYTWGSSSEMVLNDSDYAFTELVVYMSEYDAAKVKTTVSGEETWVWSDPYIHQEYTDYTDVEIWTRTEGDSDFKLYRTLKASEFIITDDDESTQKKDEREEYGIINCAVTLPDKTVGYQIRHTSEFFSSQLYVTANMKLKSTNHVLTHVRSDVAGGYDSLIKNNSTLYVNNTKIKDSMDTKIGGATLCAYQLGIGNSFICADKRCAPVPDAEIEGNYEEFAALICGWGYTDSEDSIKLIESGEFNDLLPYNFTVDKSSIYVKPIFGNIDGKTEHTVNNSTGGFKTIKSIQQYVTYTQYDSKLKEKEFYLDGTTYDATPFSQAYWSVKFTENWEGSGRTMMTISISTPADIEATGYYVFYNMKTTLSNISANGTTQTNYVSFTDTTENQSVPLSKEGNITGIEKKFQTYYTSIDNKYTAFASAATSMIKPSTSVTGINNAVTTDGVLETKNITVGLDADYTFSVTHGNSLAAKDIIIYDILHNDSYAWNGSFVGIDISSLTTEEMKSESSSHALMDPKILYCIKDSDVTEEDLDISNTAIWTETVPADKSTIKAIAVDCRTDVDGEDYWLPAKMPISFNIMMHSPSTAEENYTYTYNEAHVTGYSSNDRTYAKDSTTSVMLYYATPTFEKTSFPESGADAEHPAGVVNKSVINYNLAVTNPDDSVAIKNVVVEDLLDANLTVNNMPKVQIGTDDPVPFNKAPIISSYEITEEEGGRSKFTATISSVAPGETITLILPATVNAELDTQITNTASVVRANGLTTDIQSGPTYHYVTVKQAKIKKVDSKGDALAGALLRVYENTSDNFESNGDLKEEATPLTVRIGGEDVTEFYSTDDVLIFPLETGDYVLHEVKAPGEYKVAADIPFTIDIEGITHVDGESVNYVEMVDEPAYKIVFHENKPGAEIEEANKIFKVVEPKDLVDGKIEHFYEIPDWAGDEYVFAGWYYGGSSFKQYASTANIKNNATTALIFETKTFTGPNSTSNDANGAYHVYAKWIQVNAVKTDSDDKSGEDGYRGFGLVGVQIRDEGMTDPNYNGGDETRVLPAGMRYITSLSESLLTEIDNLSTETIATAEGNVGVEYGYAVATEANINAFIDHYDIKDTGKYKLQYKGDNVNGVNTDPAKGEGTAETDFRYVTNVNCTRGTTNSMGTIAHDHKEFDDYRLYSLVVTYEGEEGRKGDKIDARAYLRYTDANGWVRVFYNDYRKNMYYGGCLCSYNQARSMYKPADADEDE